MRGAVISILPLSPRPTTQVLEGLGCDGEASINFDAECQDFRSSCLLDATLLAAVEKKRWSTQTRWGYHALALTADSEVIRRAQRVRPTPFDTIDLSSPSSSKPIKRSASSSTSPPNTIVLARPQTTTNQHFPLPGMNLGLVASHPYLCVGRAVSGREFRDRFTSHCVVKYDKKK